MTTDVNKKTAFVLIGASGYVAPKHLKAIKENGGNLIAALDPHDSVGILDSYFPECSFFTEFERLDRYCCKLVDSGEKIDYVSICSPNYLHDAHCRFSLRIGADAICEKPLVLKERNLDQLKVLEDKTGNKIYTILQLRLNETLQKLKNDISKSQDYNNVTIDYITPRGKWYKYSWKGDIYKSGGLHTNIGIHLFDLMQWVFGECQFVDINEYTDESISGIVDYKNAECNFFLSTKGQKPRRILNINDNEIEFSSGFTNLHTLSYKNIIEGNGFGIEDSRPSIKLCEHITQLIT